MGTLTDALDDAALTGGGLPQVEKQRSIEQAKQHQGNIIVNLNVFGKMTAAELEQVRHTLAGLGLASQPMLGAIAPSPTVPLSEPTNPSALGVSYRDYCVDETLDVPRSFGGAIAESTFAHESRLLRQLEREGVPLDPPSVESFNAWATGHGKTRAGLDNHRRAYARLLGYHGVAVPRLMLKRWDTKKAVARANRAGLLRSRQRHLKDGPWDVLRLLKARPWMDERLNEAFHHLVTLACVTGPRSSEPRELLVANVNAEKRSIVDWWQEKKDYGRRVDVPESWLFNGPGPSVKWYLQQVRPKFEPAVAEARYFVSTRGHAYASEQSWRMFVGNGMRHALGYAIGPHAFRRFCATIRTVYGWTLPQVAEFLDDTERVVERSYIDWSFVRAVGIRHKKDPRDRPPMPPLWRLPKDLGLDRPTPEKPAMTCQAPVLGD